MTNEVNLLSLYRRKTAEVVKAATAVDLSKEFGKISNLITNRTLLIDDIIGAMNQLEKDSPGSYLKTRFYNRATRRIDTVLPEKFKLNNIIVENVSRGTIDEEAKPGTALSTHYTIPALMYDLKSNFESIYKIPPGYYIFSHQCYLSSSVPRPEDKIFNTIFHLDSPLYLKYSLSDHTLVIPQENKAQYDKQMGSLKWLGNIQGGKYCLGETTRNINAMAIFFGNVFSTDYVPDEEKNLFNTAAYGFPELFNKKFNSAQVNTTVLTESILAQGGDLFFTDTQRKYFEKLKESEFVKVYELYDLKS